MMVVINAASAANPKVNSDAMRDAPEAPRLAIAREIIKARKVRPQAVIVTMNLGRPVRRKHLTYLLGARLKQQ